MKGTRNPLAALHNASRRMIVAQLDGMDTAMVFVSKRVSSLDLLEYGQAELLGEQINAEIKAVALDSVEWDSRLEAAPTEEVRATIQAEREAAERRAFEQKIAILTSTPERGKAFMSRSDAWFMASIVATGIPKPGTALGIVAAGTPPDEICENLGGPEDKAVTLLVPTRFVLRDPQSPNEFDLRQLAVADRALIGTLVAAIWVTGERVRPLS